MIGGIAGLELLFLFFSGFFGSMGIPLGISPAPEDPMMMAVAPDECVAYTTWWGMVPPKADGNVSERWMAQPEMAVFLEKLTNVWRIAFAGATDPDASDRLDQAMQLSRHVLTHAGAIYIREFEPPVSDKPASMRAGILVNTGDDDARFLDWVLSLETAISAEAELEISDTVIDGRTFRSVVLPDPEFAARITWGQASENHFAVAIGDGEMEDLLERLKGTAPEWLTNLRSRLPVDRPTCISRIDGQKLIMLFQVLLISEFSEMDTGEPGETPEESEMMEATGLSQLRQIGFVGGLDEGGFIGRTLIDLEGEPRGLFGLFSDEPIDESQLARIPGDRMLAAAASISPPKVAELFRTIARAEFSRFRGEQEIEELDPFSEEINRWNAGSGVDIENDLLANLDPFVFAYGSVNITNPASGWVFGIGASQSMAATDGFESFSQWIMSEPEEEPAEWAPRYKFSTSETGGVTWYTAKVEEGWAPISQETCWGLSESEVLLSLDRSSMRRHLRRAAADSDALIRDDWFRTVLAPPTGMKEGKLCFVSSLNLSQLLELAVGAISLIGGEFPEEFGFNTGDIPPLEVLKKDMKPCLSAMYQTESGFEVVQRQTYPGGSPLNTLAAAAILALPSAAESIAEAANARSSNNLRQLVLAMHNYHDVHGGLPARFNKHEAGEPLLSWRVLILPWVGEEALFAEFRLNEPWDSEHNKALIEKMPDVFRHPRAVTEAGKTCYLAVVGEGSAMSEPRDAARTPTGRSFEQLSGADGLSSTAMLVQVKPELAAIWTRPDDYAWAEQPEPTSGLLFNQSEKSNVAFADGSVHTLTAAKLRKIATAIFRFDDGEAVDLWSDD
jgi:prepilin-type processing-associated H-X9-DG protein